MWFPDISLKVTPFLPTSTLDSLIQKGVCQPTFDLPVVERLRSVPASFSGLYHSMCKRRECGLGSKPAFSSDRPVIFFIFGQRGERRG